MKAAAFDPPFRFRNINRIPFRYGSGRVSKKFFKDFSEFPFPKKVATPFFLAKKALPIRENLISQS
jgi:hypothetical protein